MKIKNKFNPVEYTLLVDDIADGFFDENEEYKPHFGKINAMKVFYNKCISESDIDIPDVILKYEDTVALIENNAFIEEYNKALILGAACLNFANAYKDALEIVEVRKSTIHFTVNKIIKIIEKFLSEITDTMSDDNLDKIFSLAEKVSNGNLSAESIVEAYANSKTLIEQDTNNS